MASISVAPATGVRDPGRKPGGLDRLPDELNEMKLRDDKVQALISRSSFFFFFFFGGCFNCRSLLVDVLTVIVCHRIWNRLL